ITSAFGVYGDSMYAGFCGVCYIFHHGEYGVYSGIATNVNGDKPAKKHSSDGWHVASAHGLPNRVINWIAIDPSDTKTVYLAIGNYSAQELAPPGSYLDATTNLLSGHVYKSTDAGENFTDISGNLPDIPAISIALVNGQLLLGTQLGAFISSDTNGSSWTVLGDGLPNVPVTSIVPSPADPSLVFASTYGRSIWTYKLGTAGSGASGSGGSASSRFGGALGFALLLPLTGLALLRRRRR
ncbi:MAG TPA: hypothetical protein VHE37_08410, partial [Nevskiaceae bacterium]|nr:hypothetical protein [Nevskiaceae bacterium]